MQKKKEPAVSEWDPNFKELWHLELEKMPVNDDRWTCIVTTIVPAEGQDDEHVEAFNQCVATGLRKAIKVIKMKDVVNLLRKTDVRKEKGKEGKGPGQKKKARWADEPPPAPTTRPPIYTLAARYAVFGVGDSECKLPHDLMAAVLKHLILDLKAEDILRKKWKIAREERARKKRLKRKFIRSRKPFEPRKEDDEGVGARAVAPNVLDQQEPIEDQPLGGPDMYIVLVDFHNPLYLSALVKVNVPFVAIIKITAYGDASRISQSSIYGKVDFSKKNSVGSEFWDNLKKFCLNLETTHGFQDIAIMQYHAPSLKHIESKSLVYGILFDQLSWMQYSAYFIYRQHQNYLRETHVQCMFLSLETLDLSKCEVYNKLCDALITGHPNASWMVLYAVIEQVVAGVPETESVPLEYDGKPRSDSSDSESVSLWKDETTAAFSQGAVQDAIVFGQGCNKKSCLRSRLSCKGENAWEKYECCGGERFVPKKSISNHDHKGSDASAREAVEENPMSVALIDQVLSEKKTEKEILSEKKWKSPKLYFYGDELSLHTYHCDPRLLNPDAVVDRFIKHGDLLYLWSRYPVQLPENKAFYSYHLHFLQRMSRDTAEMLKVKLYLTLCMRFMGMSYGFLYRGLEEDLSSIFGEGMQDMMKKLSRVHFSSRVLPSPSSKIIKAFPDYFIKTFIEDLFYRTPRKSTVKLDNVERKKMSFSKDEFSKVRKFSKQFNVHHVLRRTSKTTYSLLSKTRMSSGTVTSEKTYKTLYSVLEGFEFPSPRNSAASQDKEEFGALVQKFSFFERLEPRRMMQRLTEAEETYNTTEATYYAPTDTLIILSHNESDIRGLFNTNGYGVLPTPVSLRDFYYYVYPEISDWLLEEEERFFKIAEEIENKKLEEEDARNKNYLSKLKNLFCSMSEEEKIEFLESETKGPEPETEVTEKDLKDLPKKPRYGNPGNKVSFIATNLTSVRVETNTSVQEYHSRDGTEVKIVIESWVYHPEKRLTLEIKRSGLRLIHHRLLEAQDYETMFTLASASGIIFAFSKNEPETQQNVADSKIKIDLNYFLKISWPTGLMIEGVPYENSKIYVKQGYINAYRKGWDVEKERSRCFLRNGQIVVLHDSGVVEILCASGTKHVLHRAGKCKSEKKSTASFLPEWVSRCEWTTTTGEVWEKLSKGPCRDKKKLIHTCKIYVGVDWKAQEIYYRRDDGTSCMVWPDGKLVTTFPDGTKITSIPDFDKEEIKIEFTDEEKLAFLKTESRSRDDTGSRSRAILRKPNSRSSNIIKKSASAVHVEPFAFVSCSYLMEHPKYATVYFDFLDPSAFVRMPEDFTVKMEPEGNYEVSQRRKGLRVHDSEVEFYRKCAKCEEKTTAVFTPDSKSILLSLTDFNLNSLHVQKNGGARLYDASFDANEPSNEEGKSADQICTAHKKFKSVKGRANNQRCFVLERDLGGYEFFHNNTFTAQCRHLPTDTHYELNTQSGEDPLSVHTFSCPYYSVGYEAWTMQYENKFNALPTNLKKKDLVELGAKDNPKKPSKCPALPPPSPEHPPDEPRQPLPDPKPKPRNSMPKVVVTRIVKSFASSAKNITEDVDRMISAYQKKARDCCAKYASMPPDDFSPESDHRLNAQRKPFMLQNLNMYTHLGTPLPSTDLDIHYSAHFVNLMETLECGLPRQPSPLPPCKQMPRPLPRISYLHHIPEEPHDIDSLH